jgi:predicted DCC family thiol-disulfide oxidoreductase YuxK
MKVSEPRAPLTNEQLILLYDGVCGLCNRLNQFLLARDRHDRLRFASLQSDFASQVLQRHHLNPLDLDTVWVVVNYGQSDERVLARSDAILHILALLGGVWRVAKLGRVIPRKLRDALYKAVASARYRLFGKSESCMMPDPSFRHKFIEF